jgi:outer membrane protease
MKNIHPFMGLVILAYFFCPPIPGRAESKIAFPFGKTPYAFSVKSAVGFIYGHSEELVYGNSALRSQLIWDIRPLVYFGSTLGYAQDKPLEKTGLYLGLSLKFGFPTKAGTMEDWDWAADGRLTDFSSHDNYTRGAVLLDFSGGFSFPLASKYLLKAYLGLAYMYFSWDARDGYGQYEKTAWNTVAFYGAVIGYSQHWLVAFPGLAARIPLYGPLALELDFRISPLVFCKARDEHLTTQAEYYDSLRWGLYLEPRGEFTLTPRDKLSFSLFLSYRYIDGPKGESRARDTGTGYTAAVNGSAGAAFSALDAGFSINIAF